MTPFWPFKGKHINVTQLGIIFRTLYVYRCVSIDVIVSSKTNNIPFVWLWSLHGFTVTGCRFLPASLTRLTSLDALWLSENQTKPLIHLQADEVAGQRRLTCYLLPQEGGHYTTDERFEEHYSLLYLLLSKLERGITVVNLFSNSTAATAMAGILRERLP